MNDIQNSAIAAPVAGGLGLGNAFAASSMLRVGVFLDGQFFLHVSNFYAYEHKRGARLSIRGIYDFVRDEVSRRECVDLQRCHVVDAHYFRGRLSAEQIQKQAQKQAEKTGEDPRQCEYNKLLNERKFDDALLRAGITTHFMPLAPDHDKSDGVKEKGIDVWFALEAYEMAVLKRFDICAIVAGDADFVPLVRKLATLGSRVMLLAWNLDNGRTRTSQALLHEVTYPVLMHELIDNPPPERKKIIDGIFMPNSSPPEKHSHEQPDQEQPVDAPDEQGMKTGKVVMVNSTDRYGFIQPEGAYTREENAHFRFKDVAEGTDPTGLKPGAQVNFYLGESDDGSQRLGKFRCLTKHGAYAAPATLRPPRMLPLVVTGCCSHVAVFCEKAR